MLGDDFLSQEELDSLLKGLDNENIDEETKKVDNNMLDTLGEIGNIAMGSGATTLSTLLRKKVKITSPEAEIIKFGEIKSKFSDKQLVTTIKYKQGLEGMNTFLMPSKMSLIISDLMMGGDGNVDLSRELDDIALSAVAESMNQMMGAAATSMSEFLKIRVDILPPEAKIIDFSEGADNFPPLEKDEDAEIIAIKFDMEVEGLESTSFWQFIPVEFAEKIMENMQSSFKEENKPQQPMQQQYQQPMQQQPMQQQYQQPMQQQPMQQQYQQPMQQQYQQPMQQQYQQPMQQGFNLQQELSGFSSPNLIDQGSEVSVKPVNFGQIEGDSLSTSQNVDMSKLQLLFDVPLNITVELGRVNLNLREVLELHQGSLIQLDKLAGEPLDIYANGKLIARGEVVVIEENFGVRITEIVSLKERLRSLK
jgi:flagellar motor switch protein FliN/FliY